MDIISKYRVLVSLIHKSCVWMCLKKIFQKCKQEFLKIFTSVLSLGKKPEDIQHVTQERHA